MRAPLKVSPAVFLTVLMISTQALAHSIEESVFLPTDSTGHHGATSRLVGRSTGRQRPTVTTQMRPPNRPTGTSS